MTSINMKVTRTKVITVRDSDDVKSEEYHSDEESYPF